MLGGYHRDKGYFVIELHNNNVCSTFSGMSKGHIFHLTMRDISMREAPTSLKNSVTALACRLDIRAGTTTIKLWPIKCNGNNGSLDGSNLVTMINCHK